MTKNHVKLSTMVVETFESYLSQMAKRQTEIGNFTTYCTTQFYLVINNAF